MRRSTIVLIAVAVIVVASQAVRPARTNPPTAPHQAIAAHVADARALGVIGRACRDCHTHETRWPWYSQVAPVSWLVARDVNVGRRALNFSTWSAYGSDRQQQLLAEACEAVSEGEMPIEIYTLMHADASLTKADVDAICSLTRRSAAD